MQQIKIFKEQANIFLAIANKYKAAYEDFRKTRLLALSPILPPVIKLPCFQYSVHTMPWSKSVLIEPASCGIYFVLYPLFDSKLLL